MDGSPLDAWLSAPVRGVHAAPDTRHRRRRRGLRDRRRPSTRAPGGRVRLSSLAPRCPRGRDRVRGRPPGDAGQEASDHVGRAHSARVVFVPWDFEHQPLSESPRPLEGGGPRRSRSDDDDPRGRGHVSDRAGARHDVCVHRELLGARLPARDDLHGPRAHRLSIRGASRSGTPPSASSASPFAPPSIPPSFPRGCAAAASGSTATSRRRRRARASWDSPLRAQERSARR